ncbi:iron-enterobactin transporter subunit; membrane component of ABC superfamily [Hyella patelloides LEGE 07179]|uniref:Iron-enterobactin transporter subunit membrane component of ABC superfamily n=1 Tax=Hyella patelloides LEGE 07179 TaxID=945734 RepID=A0A563VNE7_9CYAN|nr:iron ABC transporter permease [Hyella patelloides]VEP12964.1 iron-enterobactin transporter subunit; membrane component of ABC superfamily [Hyella patelloides LEGE 07179]
MTITENKSYSLKTRGRLPLILGLLLGGFILWLSFIASVTWGAADIPFKDIYQAFTAFDGSSNHLIIRTVRLPRSLIALLVGAALAVAGAIMQGLTRNPLASPGILGVNAGAAFAVVVGTFIFGSSSLNIYAWYAFAGAAISAITVYLLGSVGRGGLTPFNLTIAGAALTAFISSVTSGILIISQRTLEEIRFWLAGSVAGRDLNLLLQVLPYICVGLILALALSRQITILSLGEDTARSLGQSTILIKILAAISIILLAGASVAIAGPIGFVGLIVPHIVRLLVGVDYRWILPYSAIFGAIIVLIADICGRLVVKPSELPVGLIMPLIGAPFFIYLIRWKLKR